MASQPLATGRKAGVAAIIRPPTTHAQSGGTVACPTLNGNVKVLMNQMAGALSGTRQLVRGNSGTVPS